VGGPASVKLFISIAFFFPIVFFYYSSLKVEAGVGGPAYLSLCDYVSMTLRQGGGP